MEVVLDKIVSELESMRTTNAAGGGISDVLAVSSIKLFDPGIVGYFEYPFIIVEPVREEPVMETVGLAGRDIRDLEIRVSLLIDASEYYDASVSEAPGDRKLVQVASAVRRWFSRKSNRTLDNTVRRVSVTAIDYLPQERGEVFSKSAIITLIVQKAYQHEA